MLAGRDAERLDQARSQICAAHAADVETLVADLADPDGLAAGARRLREPGRPVDLLTNNAGSPSGDPLLQMSQRELQNQVAVNVTAMLCLTHSALGPKIARGHRRGRLACAPVL